jgi:hypothetical protein
MARQTEPDGSKPPPKCKAILLCEQVILDARTRKHSVIGIFDGFQVMGFPCAIPPLHAFVQLVDGIGRYELSAEIHDLRDNLTITRLPPLVVEFPERTNTFNMTVGIAGLIVPHEGVYDFVMFADGKEIDRQRLTARLAEGNEDGRETHDDHHDGDE